MFNPLQTAINMNKLRLFISLFFMVNLNYGQELTIGQFAVWKPKEAQLQNFENGYKQHLSWHKKNGDKWGWYGWYVISGPRYGQFVDATFDHSWADFDKAIKPAEDMADNRLHVFPFGEVQTIFKVSNYRKASTIDTFVLKTKLIRFVTLTVGNIEQALKLTEKLKDFYVGKQIRTFKTFRVIDGGATNQIILMMGFESWEGYAISETLNEKIEEIEQGLKQKVINSIISETLIYRTDMSWFPD